MASIVVSGDTSGAVTISAPAVAGTTTLTLPTATGTLATLTTPSFGTTIGVGGATASASGSGITFPATQSASSDANTLDDYEEGTWTPTFTSVTGSITSYTTSNGTYTKIGNTVSVQVFVNMTNAGTAGATLLLTLPFAPVGENWAGFGAEIAAVGFVLSVFGTSSSLGFRKYENSTAAGTGYGFKIGAVYRTA